MFSAGGSFLQPEDIDVLAVVISGLVEEFKKTHKVIDVDGARVLFDGGWGLVRASNTQPVLVLRFEARDQIRLDEIRQIFMEKLDRKA